MTDRDAMTADEAERRVDSVHFYGGTEEERRFALKRWKEALVREAAVRRAEDNRKAAQAVR